MATISINDKRIEFKEGEFTILEIAKSAGIYIPTLCNHEELEPHGGCRMCLVDVEGINGYVPACSTTAGNQMAVTTNTEGLMDLKRRIMQLLLIEHPSACLVCSDLDSCREYRNPANKAGQSTGCNTCSNYQSCELRDVVEYLGINDLQFKPHYKEIPVEQTDPFFDRDYNLCILCGRCVRVCRQVRGTSAICFSDRGYESRVDTAYGVSHLDSGCWFCGACVDVCPTGALASRASKWIGEPEKSVETTCILCGMGCQVELETKWNKIMGAQPGAKNHPPNFHHMCVLGRFCIPSIVNMPDRLQNPMIRKGRTAVPVPWEKALDRAVKLLCRANPESVAFIAGPHMTTESAYLFQKLAHKALKTSNLDFRGSVFPFAIHVGLSQAGNPQLLHHLEDIKGVDWILAVGGDFVMNHQIVAKNVYSAVKKGTPLFVIGKAGKNLRRWSAEYYEQNLESVASFVNSLRKAIMHGSDDYENINHLTEQISDGRGAVIIGSRIMQSSDPMQILNDLIVIAGKDGLVYPLFPHGNEVGLIRAGVHPFLPPGTKICYEREEHQENGGELKEGLTESINLAKIREAAENGEIDTLYVVDGSVDIDGFQSVTNIIYQSPFPSIWTEYAHVILPSATFPEESGTFINIERRELKLNRVIPPMKNCKEDWQIFVRIGKKLAGDEFSYNSTHETWEELSRIPHSKGCIRTERDLRIYPNETSRQWIPCYRGAILPERIAGLMRLIESRKSKETKGDLDVTLEAMIEQVRDSTTTESREGNK